jgi:hypothetical protein
MSSLLALAFMVLTSHCRMEALPGFEFLHCITEAQSSDDHHDPCKEGRCCSIEFAQYQAPRHQEETVPIAISVILPRPEVNGAERSLPAEVSLGVLTAAPPEITKSWQFFSRTASPPRAPSFTS